MQVTITSGNQTVKRVTWCTVHWFNICRLHSRSPLYVVRSQPIQPINVPYPYISTCSGDHWEIIWERWALYKGLESEGMGLPRDVFSGATCVGHTAAHPVCADSSHHTDHTPNMHRCVKAVVNRGRRGAWLASPDLGNAPPSPLPCSCFHRGQLVWYVSVHTDHPYLWQNH